MADESQTDAQAPPLAASFANFLATLQLQTLVFLGAVPNPATKETQQDLGQARYMIDMLGIIEEKTKGNLDETEQKILVSILHDVRIRYVHASGSA